MAAKTKGAGSLQGRRVAVAYNLHRCRRDQPRRRREACFSLRNKPSSSSKVLGYREEVWLEDAIFFVRPAAVKRIQESGTRNVCCYVVGTLMGSRPRRLVRKTGWSAVRLDVFDEGCFYRASTGACVHSAKFVHLHERSIRALGLKNGEPVTSLAQLESLKPNPDLPIYGPRRKAWRGDLGGLNFEIADAPATGAAIHWVLARHPGCVIVDGTDDWNAPLYARPHPLLRRYHLQPVAWWHTGMSGQGTSGAVMDPRTFRSFTRAYEREWGFEPERCPGIPPALTPAPCGCWTGEGLRIYRL